MAQIRSAANHFRIALRGPAGILPRLRLRGNVPCRAPPVGAPFPDVAGRLVEPVTVRPECIDGRRCKIAIVAGIDIEEAALPDVAAMLAVGLQRIAPRIARAFEAAARGTLPFGFGRQTLPGPCGVG